MPPANSPLEMTPSTTALAWSIPPTRNPTQPPTPQPSHIPLPTPRSNFRSQHLQMAPRYSHVEDSPMQDVDTDAIAENAAFLQRPFFPQSVGPLESYQERRTSVPVAVTQEQRPFVPVAVTAPGPLGRYLDQRGSGESRQVSLDNLSRTLREERRRRIRPPTARPQQGDIASRPAQNNEHATLVDEMLNRAGTRVRMPPNPTSAIQAARERYNSLLEMREAHDRTQQQELARTPYSNGAPHSQTLYDWAPAVTVDLGGNLADIIYRRIQEQQPNTHPDVLRQLARQEVEDISRTAAQQARRQNIIQEEDRQRAARLQEQEDQARNSSLTPSSVFDRVRLDSHERSVHSAQILRDMRRQSALTARSRDLMTRYAVEREQAQRSGTPPTDPRTRTSPIRMSRGVPNESRYELNRMAWQASQRAPTQPSRNERESTDSLRRRYLDNPAAPTPKISEFERIIKSLHLLSDDEAEIDQSLAQLDGFEVPKQQNAKSVDRPGLRIACPPHPTSWLVPGMVFTGAQQSAGALSNSFGLRRPGGAPYNLSTTGERRSNHQAESEPIFYTATPLEHINLEHPDRWVVRVSIHDVDYDDLTLQGTMEAFNVPNSDSTPTADPNKTTFSTYLTGELLDFHRHTLLTSASSLSTSPPSPSLNSATSNATLETTPDVDAMYWRALPPFNQISDSDLARGFLDPAWIEREISQKYVLMRWKERSFVSPSYEARENTIWAGGRRPQAPEERTAQFMPGAGVIAGNSAAGAGSGVGSAGGVTGAGGRQFGLSISGFYYVSLRRSDGKLEGLYFDPQSSPYQKLELRPERKAGGMWMCGSAEII